MFDFHTHVLPGIDDGSSSIEESLAMLTELKRQGVDGIAATPHFYADSMSPEVFFEKRQGAWEQLASRITPELPEIHLGAEVRYFEGITRYDGLEQFCMEGTPVLLVEMPHGTWTKRMIEALAELNDRESIVVLLAHVERYFREQPRDTWKQLLGYGIRMQASAEFFVDRQTRRTAIRSLREGRIHLLGSDCHNMTSRPPNMAAALDVIRRKKCSDHLLRMKRREHMLLQHEEIVYHDFNTTQIGGG